MRRRSEEIDDTRRFRDAAMPHLDGLYTYACHLLRCADDADDAVEECYLRAFRDYDAIRAEDIKPWLMRILRSVCHTEFAQRSRPAASYDDTDLNEDTLPLWQGAQMSPEKETLRQRDPESIRGLLEALPEALREAIVLRDVNDLSYREIARVIGVPVGTVMARIARARSVLLAIWVKVEHGEEQGIEQREAV
jgi:RNA polymerase sigma-70 factor (ECF subfamily)